MVETVNEIDFEGALVTLDGSTPGWNDRPVGTGKIFADNLNYWFSVETEFHENGYDFWKKIKYFGFLVKGAAGTKNGEGRSFFTGKQVASAKRQIEKFYLSDEGKNVFPFGRPNCKFLGVKFADGCFLLKD